MRKILCTWFVVALTAATTQAAAKNEISKKELSEMMGNNAMLSGDLKACGKLDLAWRIRDATMGLAKRKGYDTEAATNEYNRRGDISIDYLLRGWVDMDTEQLDLRRTRCRSIIKRGESTLKDMQDTYGL